MKHWWWKFLAAFLLLFTVIAGLHTPLRPALMAVHPDRIAPGDVTVNVRGYRTAFFENVVAFWIENDSQRVCAHTHRVVSNDELELQFNIPYGMRAEMSDLVVRTRDQGDLRYPGAFYTEGRGPGINSMIAEGCRPAELTMEERMGRSGFVFPDRTILNETIRNLFFHVPMWFAMVVLMTIGAVHSVLGLRNGDAARDRSALAAVRVGLLFGVLGLISGSIWARTTWGTWWTADVKLNGAAVGVLIYLAYLVLRGSVQDPARRARLAGVYSIFAYCFMLLFFFVLPRLNAMDSLHPGNGGNPAFATYDLDNSLRAVFYPACAGWILLGCWMYDLNVRLARLKSRTVHA